MKQLASYTAIILTTLGGVLLLWQFRTVVALFVLSLFAAAMMRPLIARLVQWGLSAAAARTTLFLIVIIGPILLFVLLGGELLREFQHLSDRLTLSYEMNFARWQVGSSFEKALTTGLPQPSELYEALAGTNGELLLSTLFGATESVLGVLGSLLLVLILSLYWSNDQDRFERLWLSLLSAGQRIQARDTWRTIETTVGSYLRSELLQSFVAALLIGLGLAVIGVPYPLLAAVVAGIVWLIPLAGAVIIAAMTFALGNSVSLGLGLSTLAYTLIVLYLLEFVIEPLFYNQRRYSSLLVILFMWALADLFGLLGLILAPALAAASQLLLHQLLNQYQISKQQAPIANLEARYGELYEAFSKHTDKPYPPEIANILERLNELIRQTKMTIHHP